jgi:hypothetical protein
MKRILPSLTALLVGFAWLGASAALAEEEEQPSAADARKAQKYQPVGTVRIQAKTVAVGIAVHWGEGTLSFQGEDHAFKVGGLDAVGVGGSSIDAEGTVFNLEKLEDFEGAWVQVSGGVVIGEASAGGITMRNGGVYMTLSGRQKGAQISAGGGGLEIRFVKDAGADAE